AEGGVPRTPLHHVAERAALAVARVGAARCEQPPAGDPSPDGPGVGTEGVQSLREGGAVGRQRAGPGAAVALLDDGSAGDEQRRAGIRLDAETRAHHAARERRQIGPAVGVEVLPLLAVEAGEERPAAPVNGWRACPQRAVEACLRGDVYETRGLG